MGERAIMKGNEALAEAAVRAGCRFYSGYPITPQTEVLEYLSWRMAEVNGTLVQTEDEITGLHMIMGAGLAGARCLSTSAGPGFALFQEGISYLSGTEVPSVLVDVQRVGSACGDIGVSQGDYDMIKGNGNGDSYCITLTPASVQEMVDFTVEAFDLAEKYRMPVIILADAVIGQMMEGVTLPDFQEHDINKYDWSVKGMNGKAPTMVAGAAFNFGGWEPYADEQRRRRKEIMANEQRYENVNVADADVVMVAHGCSSRVCKEAVKKAEAKGIKLGLIRPKAVIPYPVDAFKEIKEDCKGLLVVEMSAYGQTVPDVKLASQCKFPVYGYFSVSVVPDSDTIISMVEDILAGKAEEV